MQQSKIKGAIHVGSINQSDKQSHQLSYFSLNLTFISIKVQTSR